MKLPPLEPGQIHGDYVLVAPIGAGGFSAVWRARHAGTGEIVALKFPRVEAFIQHLRREELIASHLRDPQVVEIRESRLDRNPPFVVMAYIDGADLAVPAAAPPPEGIVEGLRRFRKIAEVVARLHRADVVHGDLKPGNIRFDAAGVCRLLDLGLARRQIESRRTTTLRASIVSVDGKKIAGTLDYMAPEVLSGDRPGPPADVYALGVILHELLCGRPPAFGVSAKALNPFLPAGAAELLRAMLAADPARRPPDAAALPSPVDDLIAAEERCLRRRNGHARRRIFYDRMETLGRGIRVLGLAATIALFAVFGWPFVREFWTIETILGVSTVAVMFAVGFAFIGLLLGMTTINAFLMGIPEKSYKNRKGHPIWSFMMR